VLLHSSDLSSGRYLHLYHLSPMTAALQTSRDSHPPLSIQPLNNSLPILVLVCLLCVSRCDVVGLYLPSDLKPTSRWSDHKH